MQVGSGKSSLLSALLGEMIARGGCEVTVSGAVPPPACLPSVPKRTSDPSPGPFGTSAWCTTCQQSAKVTGLRGLGFRNGAWAAGTVGYTSQDPWIVNSTLRDNITMGAPFEQGRYDRTLAACALGQDIAGLAGGDAAEIGEKGINLSGGQRARVSLARACYAGAHITAPHWLTVSTCLTNRKLLQV